MKNIINFKSIVIIILFAAVTSLVHTNNQILEQNRGLTSQVSQLNLSLKQVTASTDEIEQRMSKIEQKLEPKFYDLLVENK